MRSTNTAWCWQREPDWQSFLSHNFLLLLILGLGLPRLFSLFRTRTESERRYYSIPTHQRWQMGAAYFGLLALLVLGMRISRVEVESEPMPVRTKTVAAESPLDPPIQRAFRSFRGGPLAG